MSRRQTSSRKFSSAISLVLQRTEQCGRLPGILHLSFQPFWITAHAFRLMPFRKREVQRIARLPIFEPVRHVPTVLEIELARQGCEFSFKMRKFDRFHLHRINAGPHRMGVAANLDIPFRYHPTKPKAEIWQSLR